MQLKNHPNLERELLCEILIGFYKWLRFLKNACIRVEIIEEHALDSGGVRRQFFSTCFDAIANGELQVFEGPSTRV